MLQRLRKFLNDTGGATAIEYALIGSLISIVIVGAASQIGTSSIMNMDLIASALSGGG